MKFRQIVIVSCILMMHMVILKADTLNYVSPVDHQIRLTGNFMELRGNHFHAGIDIKSSEGKSGDPIYAVAEGFVSRIKVQSGGYGNVIYIDHPNGYTSVYAHLNNFNDKIGAFVKKLQYQLESFEIDIYLPDSSVMLNKRSVIGNMGNTGRSFGPHLHFEIRETVSEKPINPEQKGIGPTDNKPPVLQSLHIYELGENSETTNSQVRYFNPGKRDYELYSSNVQVASEYVGLGLQMYDQMDGSSNKNGIYSYKLFVDGELEFGWEANEFSFDQDLMMKGFLDFNKNISYSQKVYLLYRQACNLFTYYSGNSDGIIHLPEGKKRKIEIHVTDLYGNQSKLNFHLMKEAGAATTVSNLVRCDTSFNFKGTIFEIRMPAFNLFGPATLEVQESEITIEDQLCKSISIGDRKTAVKDYYTILIDSHYIDQSNKMTLASRDANGKILHYGLAKRGNQYFSRVNVCGEFFLFRDNVKPSIDVLSMNRDLLTPWKIKITDNIIPTGKIDDLQYRATVDGKWILMQYDKKNDLLFFDDFSRLPDKPFQLKIQVKDYCNNIAEMVYTIN